MGLARVNACVRHVVLFLMTAALFAPAAAFATGPGGGFAPDPVLIAGKICSHLQAKGFTGETDCVATMTPVAHAAIGACAGQPTDALQACMESAIRSSVHSTLAGGAGATKAATKLAAQLCSKLSTRRGYVKRFGDAAGCESTLLGAAKAAIDGCAGTAGRGSADFKRCVMAALRSAAKPKG